MYALFISGFKSMQLAFHSMLMWMIANVEEGQKDVKCMWFGMNGLNVTSFQTLFGALEKG